MEINPTKRGKSWLQKLTLKVSLSPELFGVDIHNHLPSQQRLRGWETQGKWEVIFSQGLPLSLLHPVPTATSHGTGDKSSQGHAVELSCSSSFSWLWSHHTSPVLHPKTPHAQQPAEGTEEPDPWWLSAKYCHFWLAKLIIAAETLPCPAERGVTRSKSLYAMKVPSSSHTWDVHHEVLL